MSGSGRITDGVNDSDSDGPDLGPLAALIGVSAGGFSLVENPIGFVQYLVLDLVQQTALDVSGAIGARLIELNDILLDSTVGVLGTAVGDSISFVAESIIGLIDAIGDIANSLAAGAGPLGIIVIPLVWAGAILGVSALLLAVWRGYLLVRSAIL